MRRLAAWFEPPAAITDPRRRRRLWLSQLISLVAASITAVVLVAVLVLSQLGIATGALSLAPVAVALVGFTCSFALCRLGHDRAATWLLFTFSTIAPLVGATVNQEPVFAYQLYAAVLPGFLASVLLSAGEAVAVITLAVLGVAALPALSDVPTEAVIGPLIFGLCTVPIAFMSGALVARDLRREEEARREAEAAKAAMARFLARAGHELRTPLTSIQGFLDLIVEDATERGDEALLADLGAIGTSCSHLMEIVEEVMLLSRLDVGQLTFETTEVALDELVAECAAIARPLASERSNTLEVEPAPATRVRADRRRAAQVLLNLLSNACRYTEEGTIRVRFVAVGDDVRVEVVDTGVGLNAEERELIFEEFWRARHAGGPKGTGLGLPIARQLARAMGGDIEVNSVEGKGSTFAFRLPRARA
jgi:signal transduction histidine kinase